MSSTGKVMTVDLYPLGLGREYEPSQEEWLKVARELGQVLAQSGIAYLKHHTVTQDQINRLTATATTFFNLDQDKKDRYGLDADGVMGYAGVGGEGYSDKNEYEIHESYNIGPDTKLPDDEVPSLRPAVAEFATSCSSLVNVMFKLLSLDLDEDPAKILSMHKGIYTVANFSCTRLNYYPPILDTVPANSTRFGTHTDFDTFTFLYQDDIGGLQIIDKSGCWVDIDPVPGSILFFTGEVLEGYSKKKYYAPKHRVVIPEKEILRKSSRISIPHFVTPDNDVLLPFTPEGRSSSDPPMTYKEYSVFRFKKARK